tara:strand:+ start:104 stop:331 length:228 start_codon:yes stop_codon:yes gene_type:complete
MKKDKHPFTSAISVYTDGGIVENRFGGDSIKLNALELSIYDSIMGCEMIQDWKNHRLGLDWFRKFNGKAYMVLLD